jgi:hypothetical protein
MEEGESFSKKKKKRGKKKNFGLSLFNNKKKVNLDVN